MPVEHQVKSRSKQSISWATVKISALKGGMNNVFEMKLGSLGFRRCVEPFLFYSHSNTSPHLLQLSRSTPQRSSAVKLHKYFETSPDLPLAWEEPFQCFHFWMNWSFNKLYIMGPILIIINRPLMLLEHLLVIFMFIYISRFMNVWLFLAYCYSSHCYLSKEFECFFHSCLRLLVFESAD